jgi:NitT/TauT family transport system substrate-binding protein
MTVRKSLWLSIVFLLLFAPLQLAAQPSKIHVSAPSRSLTWFPAHLAREKGFYRAEGLDVDFVLMKPQVALQALIAGDVGYTTALGSTMRAGIRGLPLRVVMTIADKPLFALMARRGVNSVEELRGKLLGISSFGAEGSYEMAVTSWSKTGAANPEGVQIAMEEIKIEQKLEMLSDSAKAFDWSFVQR